MTIQFAGIQTFLLVFVRMIAMLGFNPLMQRRNVPRRVVVALAVGMTFLLGATIPPAPAYTGLDMAMAILRETFIGYCCGFVFQIFYYLLFYIGDFMDQQFGWSMAKVFDPGTNIQASITGTIFNILFVLYFFATGSHLIMLRIFATSYMLIPAGAAGLAIEASSQLMLELFTSAFALAVRLLLPFAVAEFVVEVCMGVLMKLIPQIHVFVINMQIKLMLGITLLMLFAPAVASFIDRYLVVLTENMQRILYSLGGG